MPGAWISTSRYKSLTGFSIFPFGNRYALLRSICLLRKRGFLSYRMAKPYMDFALAKISSRRHIDKGSGSFDSPAARSGSLRMTDRGAFPCHSERSEESPALESPVAVPGICLRRRCGMTAPVCDARCPRWRQCAILVHRSRHPLRLPLTLPPAAGKLVPTRSPRFICPRQRSDRSPRGRRLCTVLYKEYGI